MKNKNHGQLIRMLRRRYEISQDTLAELVGKSRATINSWENNGMSDENYKKAETVLNDYIVENGLDKGCDGCEI